jgi:uncharacterized SAM-binding protein YcdF (DUF218 family)
MKLIRKILQFILLLTGTLATVMVILAFTSAPFWAWYGLGTKEAGIHRPPDCIVLMGGGGMPSESGLMRTWYTAKVANWFTRARVIIALPGDTADSLSSVNQMKRELVLRGIAPERIFFEDSGTNTRAQAINIWKRVKSYELGVRSEKLGVRSGELGVKSFDSSMNPLSIVNCSLLIVNCQLSILIVTSPEHLYRSVLAFRKAGFKKVDGLPAFEQAIESDISFSARRLGGSKLVPDIGDNITLRYQFWTQLHYEILVIREWLALGYYRISGWI